MEFCISGKVVTVWQMFYQSHFRRPCSNARGTRGKLVLRICDGVVRPLVKKPFRCVETTVEGAGLLLEVLAHAISLMAVAQAGVAYKQKLVLL